MRRPPRLCGLTVAFETSFATFMTVTSLRWYREGGDLRLPLGCVLQSASRVVRVRSQCTRLA